MDVPGPGGKTSRDTFDSDVARRLGLVRAPVVTGVVFAVTATTGIAQFYVPGMLQAWQRTPDGLHGELWRTFTALLVQDGGVVGTLSNLAFLLILGVLAEQVVGRWRWLVCYLGAGLVGELAGYAWQPYGAGNSVAVCGLAGALVVALWTQHPRSPRLTLLPVAWWCGLLLASRWLWPGVVLLVAAGALIQRMLARGLLVGRPVAAAAAVVAVALLAAENVHGAALAAGTVIAALAVRTTWPIHGTDVGAWRAAPPPSWQAEAPSREDAGVSPNSSLPWRARLSRLV